MALRFNRAAGIDGQSRTQEIRLIGLVIATLVADKAGFDFCRLVGN